jgi:PAS domain S-box-containing protein
VLERELFTLLEGTSDAAFAVDQQGSICSWNRAAEKLLGYTTSEVLRKSCAELFQGRGALGTLVCCDECEILECLSAKREIPNYDLEVLTRSGRRVWVNVTIIVFSEDRSGHKLAAHLMRDISDRKRSEELTQNVLQSARQLVSMTSDGAHPAPVSPLTEQEKRVLSLLAKGKSPGEVARELGITPRTLRNHIHHANHKLRTRNRLETVMHAIRRGLI